MTSDFVVDASVALKWFVVEADSDIAEQLLERARLLHAPILLRIELANAIWKNCRRRTIGEEQARAGLGSIGRTIGRWHDTDRLLPQAFDWSLAYDHPVYDFCYLALARSLGIPFVTADSSLVRKLAGRPEASSVLNLKDAAA